MTDIAQGQTGEVREGDIRVDPDGDCYRVDRIEGGWCYVTWQNYDEPGRLPPPGHINLSAVKYDPLQMA